MPVISSFDLDLHPLEEIFERKVRHHTPMCHELWARPDSPRSDHRNQPAASLAAA
jgi:hypothetical protein